MQYSGLFSAILKQFSKQFIMIFNCFSDLFIRYESDENIQALHSQARPGIEPATFESGNTASSS